MSVLEYLEAPRGAYIDTGFKPNNKSSVIADVTVLTSNKSEYWFGAWNVAYNNGAFAVCNDGGNLYTGYGNSGGPSNPRIAAGCHTIHFTNGVTYVDGSLHTDRSAGGTFQVNHNLYIFGQNRAGSFLTGQSEKLHIHSFKIFDDGVLVRDYVPVLRNGEYCFYERVSHEFAYNVGTGEFAGGEQTGETVDIAEEVSVPIDFDVDLAGHSLTLVDTVGSGTITDTIGGGELHIDVAAGETVENSSLTFAGQMKLVKDGAGTFIGAKADQTYTGGTVANAGWLKQGAYSGAWGPHKSLVTIQTGAGFDWNGKVNDSTTTAYSFKIAGTGPDGDAAMKTSVDFAGNYWNANFIADMELDGDATVKTGQTFYRVYGFIYKGAFGHNLEMNGHTLTVVANDAFGFRGVTATGGGTIVCVPDESQNTGMRRLSFYGATNDLSTMTLDIHDRCGLNVEASVIVTNLIDRRTLQWNNGTKDNNGLTSDKDSTAGIFVIGRFKPYATNLFTKVTLGDATHLSPILDLSQLTDAFGPSEDGFELAFENGATVVVDVGARATAIGDKLVSWSEMPVSSVSFTLAYDGTDREQALAVKPDGLYVKSAGTPAYAVLDAEEESGWKFYNEAGAVVSGWTDGITQDIQVRFSSWNEWSKLNELEITPSSFLMMGPVMLDGPVDFSDGIHTFEFEEGLTIDVKGSSVVLPTNMTFGAKSFTVTSSVAGGQLEVTVDAGKTNTISAMSLTGSLRLVKKGNGTLVGAKANQTYTGGTLVEVGVVQSAAVDAPWGDSAMSVITVEDGATFDFGKMPFTATTTMYSYDIAGTGFGGMGAIYYPATYNASYSHYSMRNLTLSGDALIVHAAAASADYYCGFIKGNPHTITMNNHTLTIDAGAKFNFVNTSTVGSGTIVFMTTQTVTGNNRMASFWSKDCDFSSVTFDMGTNCRLNIDSGDGIVTFGTFIDRGLTAGNGNRGLYVRNCYRPMTTNFYKSLILGDAEHLSPILDLSALDEPFMLPAATYTLTVADDATMYVKLGDRRVRKSVPLITWTTKPASIDSIHFAAYDRRGKIKVKDDGVYLFSGMAITIR